MAKQKKTTQKPKAPASALMITKKEAGKLSPNQAAFNKLTARIEKLRKDIERKESQLEKAIQLYGAGIPPLEEQRARQNREMLSLAMPFYRKDKMPKTLQAGFKAMLRDLLDNAIQLGTGEPDEELKAFFAEIQGEDYDEVAKREDKEMQKEMREQLEDLGIDIDWNEDEPMTEEAMAEKMRKLQEQLTEKMAEEQERRQNAYKTRPKTAKALEKEKKQQEAEAYRQKNITTIYRQLVKLLHPDLERDEERRLEKEVLMKQVTEAYETKNLHALLMLELKWVHNENSHLESLTEEKLAIYLEILRKQAIELEQQKWQVINQPRYHVLVERYGYSPLTYPEKAVKEDMDYLKDGISRREWDLERMKGPKPLPILKEIVRDWMESQKSHELDFLVEMLFAQRGFRE